MTKISIYAHQLANDRFTPCKGRLYQQQDSYYVPEGPLPDNVVFAPVAAVFDGHGLLGHVVSREALCQLARFPLETLRTHEDLYQVPLKLEEMTHENPETDKRIFVESGTTMVALFIETGLVPNLWLLNLGDSRGAAYSLQGEILDIYRPHEPKISFQCSVDHCWGSSPTSDFKPGQTAEWWEREKNNIKQGGGDVTKCPGEWIFRTDGALAISRGLFDTGYKILKTPDIYKTEVRKGYVVLASDGVWDELELGHVGLALVSPHNLLGLFTPCEGSIEDKLQDITINSGARRTTSTKMYRFAMKLCCDSIKEGFGTTQEDATPRWLDLDKACAFIVSLARLLGGQDDATCQIVHVDI